MRPRRTLRARLAAAWRATAETWRAMAAQPPDGFHVNDYPVARCPGACR